MLEFMGIDIPGKVVERVLLALAVILIVAFVMANRHSQNIQHKDGATKIHSLDQRVDDQRARLESMESKIDSLSKKNEPPPVVENEPYTNNNYMPVGEFSNILK